MASEAVSTFVADNPSTVTIHCGLVYCSQTFEDFMINCATCSQEFNLLSCNFFIKHIKECLSTSTRDSGSSVHTNSNYIIENVFTTSVKFPINDTLETHFDPLLSMKIEIEPPELHEEQSNLGEELDYLSDYNDEDDLAIANNARREMLIEIIEEYKKHPLLWDASASKSATVAKKALHYNQIVKVVNAKFKTHFTDIEFRRQISRLRCSYRRALKEKNEHGSTPQLWYFDKMHFIMGTDTDLKVETSHAEPPDIENEEMSKEPLENEIKTEPVFPEYFIESQGKIFDDDEELSCDNKNGNGESYNDRKDASTAKIVLTMINEYKKHPCLWNNDHYNTSSRSTRDRAFESITKAINTTFNKHFTETAIRRKIVQLRGNYRRVLRSKEAYERDNPNATKNFHIKLHYFNQLSFIGTKCSDANILSNRHSEELHKQNTTNDCNNRPYKGLLKENCELLTCIIEEYKKQTCLWSLKHYMKSSSVRRAAYAKMAAAINDKFQTKFTPENLSTEICRLRSSYLRMLRRKRENPKYKTTMWCADMLSFIENIKDDGDDNEVIQDNDVDAISDDNISDDNDSRGKYEGVLQNRCNIQSKNYVYSFIKLYKNAPILWDKNHRGFMLRSERKKAFDTIMSGLGEEHNCQLTSEQLRHQLSYLRKCYFRALQNEVHTKPFFYDQMSFLEPFANKNTNVQKLHADIKTTPCEDFTYLTENRPLMIMFIRMYEQLSCLWDQKGTYDPSVQSEAYDKIVNTFAENGIVLTVEQVKSAINFLQTTVASTQRAIEKDTHNDQKKGDPVWFYKYLTFLGRIPRVDDKYCSHCNTHFRTAREYEKHKIDLGDSPYKCSLCNKGCATRTILTYHMNTHKEPLKCDQCDFQAYDKYNFKVHMNRHLGITPYQCEFCERGFVTSSEMRRHLLTHTGEKPVVCEICGKAFPTNSVLNQHMKRHLNQRDHKCTVCDYAFFSTEDLRNHMAGHSNERKHVCEICGASFNRKMTLRQHKTLHDEKKKHVCKICGKCFAQKAGLYCHMQSHNVLVKKS